MDQTAPLSPPEGLAEAVAAAIADNRIAADGRAVRRDGWTAERIRVFVYALAAGGSVAGAASAAGVSARSAYKLRARAQGRGFADAWDLACESAHPIRPGLPSRVQQGSVRIRIRNGHVWERHYLDNRLLMATLRRLDRKAERLREAADALDEYGFDALVDRACAAVAPPRGEAESRTPRDFCEHSDRSEEQEAPQRPVPTASAARVRGNPRACVRAIARWDRPLPELRRWRGRCGARSGLRTATRVRPGRGHDPPRSGGTPWLCSPDGRPAHRGIPENALHRKVTTPCP